MSAVYSARGRTVASNGTANHGVAALWNPHATQRLRVREIGLVAAAAPGAGSTILVARISARGTAGSTVTPTIASAHNRGIDRPSGALLDLATYSVQPTVDGIALRGWVLAAVAASGVILPFRDGIEIPPGAGLAIVNGAAIAVPASDVYFEWEE